MLLVLVAATAAGCLGGTQAGDAREGSTLDGARSVESFAQLLQAGVGYDYEPFDTPALVGQAADLVIVGRAVDVVEGRTLSGGRDRAQLNLVVKVQDVKRGPAQIDELVFVELDRPSGVTASQLARSIPPGRFLLFLDDRTDVDATGDETGRPAGAPVFAPFVQGMIIEDATTWASGLVDKSELRPAWNALRSFDDVVAATKWP